MFLSLAMFDEIADVQNDNSHLLEDITSKSRPVAVYWDLHFGYIVGHPWRPHYLGLTQKLQ